MEVDAEMSSQLEIAAATLTGPEQTIEKQNAARSLVAAQLDLLRIRNVRARLAQEIGTSPETRLLRLKWTPELGPGIAEVKV